MAKLTNLTPHSIVLCGADGQPLLTVPPSGGLARCEPIREVVGTVAVDGHKIPMTQVRLGPLTGLPEAEAGTLFIVSRLAADAARALGRDDVVVPDDSVRDASGRVMGCKALAR